MTTVQPAAQPAQSAASDIYSGAASQSSIAAERQAFTGAPGEFWAQVDSGLQSRGETPGQAHNSVRQAQQQFDKGAYDVAWVSDEAAQGEGVDQASLRKAVADYVRDTGRTAGDFFGDLQADLQGVNNMSLELAMRQADQLQALAGGPSSPT